MKKFAFAAIGGALAGAVVTTQFVVPVVAQENTDQKSTYEYLDLFGDIFERVRSSYVEEASDKELIEAAISGMLTSLDPHSSYLPPQDFDDMQVQTKGEFGGLGIEVTMENGFVKVVSPIDDTPASEAGLQPGDYITHLNGESVLGMNLTDAVDQMRGPVGSEVKITVVREGVDDPFEVTLVRDTIKIRASRARLEGNVVVLRVTTFNEQTYDQMAEGIKEQVEKAGGLDNVSGFVLDLRNNPGGLLNQAVAVSDAFLDKGEIVSTRGRDPQSGDRYNATEGDLTGGKPLVVLINGGSASASEIVAGALQDHRRAILIGAKSFGKGSVQTIMALQGEGAIRLTTARYYTPSGRSIQALGIEPDILVEERTMPSSEEDKPVPGRSEADLRGSLASAMTEEERKQFDEERARVEATAKLRSQDLQLAYALDVLKGLSVIQPEK
ncbi:S41 family peptidase [Paroceanicella profunda]|uniref:S41 family peptidase n=1 Tax=Paroceanicella profunda TaxID=2579971 RepID=A0A5B8G0X8_9RHOB|nr:S41 family peptidase [Paroceanicella profunda]QDL93480.1 S41 family peptidase [Paroceanicella profunda]